MTSTATRTAASWLAALSDSLARREVARAADLFGGECYWRDLVSFTWNIRTVEGREGIAAMLASCLPHAAPCALHLDGDAVVNGDLIEAWFRFETTAARGKGHLRLKHGKGFTLLTAMEDLKGHEERKGRTREKGINHGAFRNRTTWAEGRAQEELELGYTRQPYCVIIGGGQGGIMLGARLRRLGVPTIIIEKNPRAGDSWRNRYRTLVLHDPVWYDHLPYLPFPEHWPVFTPKDKMGDWLEFYTKIMELNYWGSSEVTKATYDPVAGQWQVHVRRDGKDIVLRPQQLVFATGSYGPPREVELPGRECIRRHPASFRPLCKRKGLPRQALHRPRCQ